MIDSALSICGPPLPPSACLRRRPRAQWAPAGFWETLMIDNCLLERWGQPVCRGDVERGTRRRWVGLGREEAVWSGWKKRKAYLSASPTRPTSSRSKHDAAVMQITRAFSGEGSERERRKKRRQQKKNSLCEREGSMEISQLSDAASPLLTDLSLRALLIRSHYWLLLCNYLAFILSLISVIVQSERDLNKLSLPTLILFHIHVNMMSFRCFVLSFLFLPSFLPSRLFYCISFGFVFY